MIPDPRSESLIETQVKIQAGAIMPEGNPDVTQDSTGGVGVIAIDGPVAAGKTVVGRALALRLGFKYLDTGVMYRAVTWLALKQRAPLDDPAALGKLAEEYPVQLQGQNIDGVIIGGYQVGPELREPPVNNKVSLVARVSSVRRSLVRQQRALARDSKSTGGIVVVGRDIGTVVLPDADLKVYLSATPESRARRRWLEMVDQGEAIEFQQVLQETRDRDEIDSRREDSPLAAAPDAFLLDTEEMSVGEVVESILAHVTALKTASKP